MVTVLINDIQVTVEDGTSILDAARQFGIEIPTFCFQKQLTRLAACRLCLVEIEGQPKLQPACVTPVLNDIKISTHSPRVVQARRSILEFILSNHPLDCPVCDKAGECELQDLVFAIGPRQTRFSEQKRSVKAVDYPLNSVIMKNSDRCIHCERCVRTCEEIVGASALGSMGRGATTEVTGFFGDADQCDHCGNCIEVCPVGAMMSRPYRYKARPWDLVEVETVCPYCSTGCQLTVALRDGRLMRVRSKFETGINQETLCARGRFGLDIVSTDNRIKRPLLRIQEELVPVSWEKAGNYLQERLQDLIGRKRPLGGLASPALTNESLYLFQKLMRTIFNTNHIDSTTRWGASDQASADLPESVGNLIRDLYTRGPLTDAIETDCIWVIGTNITDENPVIEYTLRPLLSRTKKKLLIWSPRPSRLDSLAAVSLRYLPGDEALLIASLLHQLLDSMAGKTRAESSADLELLHKAFAGIDNGKTADWRVFSARTLATLSGARSVTLLLGSDLLRPSSAPSSLQMIHNLVQVLRGQNKVVRLQMLFDRSNQLGAWDVGMLPGWLPGYRRVTDTEERGRFEKHWGTQLPKEPGWDIHQMLAQGARGELGALYIVGEDPLRDYPDFNLAKQALSEIDLLIVQDAFLSQTADLADVVLPGSTFAENDGTFTNSEGRVQRVRSFSNAAFESRRDNEIFGWIASLLNQDLKLSSAQDIFAEIGRVAPSYQTLRFEDLGLDGGFTESYPSEQSDQLFTAPPTPPIQSAGLRLITGSCRFHSGHLSENSKILTAISAEPYIEIGEEDASNLNLATNDQVLVKTQGHEFGVKLKVNKHFSSGIAFIPENHPDLQLNRLLAGSEYPCAISICRIEPSMKEAERE